MSEEKTEKPTDKKLEDAREKGQVAVSRDLARLIMLAAFMELALGTETLWREAIESMTNQSINAIGQPFLPAMMNALNTAGILLLAVFATMFVVGVVVAMVAYWGQFGVLIEPKSLEPKFDKINPVNGFKQLFSKKKLGELAMSLFKACLIGLIMYILIRDQLPDMVRLAAGEPKDIYFGFISLTRSTFDVIAGVCLVMGLIDFAMQKYFHIKSLYMDLEEIKREYREMEGDPLIKGARKQLARQLVQGDGPAKKTDQANAVVVNPTHFAIAMLFDDETPVPVVLAKGKDDMAQIIIARAKERGIPVIRHVWLARTLYATARVDTVIPKASYDAVAYVYAVIYELRKANRTGEVVELEMHGNPPDTRVS